MTFHATTTSCITSIILAFSSQSSASTWRGFGTSNTVQRQATGMNCPSSCPSPCPVSDSDLVCPAGISQVRDDCGCECPFCAKQVGFSCSGMAPCDPIKNLFCSEETHICENLPGKQCYIGAKVYSSGETFSPSCKLNCTCLDGDVGCMPACPIELNGSKPDCPDGQHAKRIRRSGQCCEEYVCTRDMTRPKSSHMNYRDQRHGSIIMGAAARRPTRIDITRKHDCMVQTTPWTECNKACGIGISERVSNDNTRCRLRRQVRLCNIRPCRKALLPANSNMKCKRTVRPTKSIRLSFSGCISDKKFKPKYCGNCGKKCCLPDRTKTRKFRLPCSDTGEILTKEYMWIHNCKCSEEYCNIKQDIFYGYQYMKSDYSKKKFT